MNSKTKLSILIATLGHRGESFLRLVDSLLTQVTDDIEIVAYWNNGEKTIGEIRQTLLESAKGEYVCFIDDDDKVPDYYCTKILENLGEDYVGFEVKFFNNGIERQRALHRLEYKTWRQDDEFFYRGVTHLNPIRRALALKGDFRGREGAGEDEAWAAEVTPHVLTEKYIPETMYFYYHETDDSFFGGNPPAKGKTYTKPEIKDKHFRYIGAV